jgi:hypothetical protein
MAMSARRFTSLLAISHLSRPPLRGRVRVGGASDGR